MCMNILNYFYSRQFSFVSLLLLTLQIPSFFLREDKKVTSLEPSKLNFSPC